MSRRRCPAVAVFLVAGAVVQAGDFGLRPPAAAFLGLAGVTAGNAARAAALPAHSVALLAAAAAAIVLLVMTRQRWAAEA